MFLIINMIPEVNIQNDKYVQEFQNEYSKIIDECLISMV